jgi:hypothetical protein
MMGAARCQPSVADPMAGLAVNFSGAANRAIETICQA